MNPPFSKESVYYPYALNFLVSLHGIIEISSRYFYNKIRRAKGEGYDLSTVLQKVYGEENTPDVLPYKDHILHLIEDVYSNDLTPTKSFMPLKVPSLVSDNIELAPDELAHEIGHNMIDIFTSYMKLSGAFLVMSYEISEEFKLDKADELANFFYHCRNAAAHNGKLKITPNKKGEYPRFPAKWRGIEITPTMHDMNLFSGIEPGVIKMADALYLVFDVSVKYNK